MTTIDVLFSRRLLSEMQADPRFRSSGKRLMKDAWVWCAGRSHWEFHGPEQFYWHGNAANAYEARYKGWSAWIDKQHPEQTA
jgi:hypothetical protein